MKKNVLAIAVATTVASAAYAQVPPTPGVFVNPENTGEVLLFPYYSADAGNDTYIHVVNTTAMGKAVKVRILEAENSQEVRDFNLYLSPKDHFSFAITMDAAGGGKLVTADNSCTVPRIKADDEATGEIEFTNLQYDGDVNSSIERTLNGHVEMIEMGQWDPTTTHGAAMVHGADGIPASCATLVESWTQGGDWYADAADHFVGDTDALSYWAGGGLYGMGTVINVMEGTSFGYDAVALENFQNDFAWDYAGGELHFPPGDTAPSLAGWNYTNYESTVFAAGEAVKLDNFVTINAVSSVLMTENVMNDYVIDPDLAATTDWVVTFPTKRFYVNPPGDDLADLPFHYRWDGDTACDPFSVTIYDREEQFKTAMPNEPQFSPYIPELGEDPLICYETNVISVVADKDAPVGVLYQDGSDATESTTRIWYALESDYDSGWVDMSWDWGKLLGTYEDESHFLPHADGELMGLPTIGFAAIEYKNGTLAGGTVANYAGAYEHKTTIVNSTGITDNINR
jgi:hypothetical protein